MFISKDFPKVEKKEIALNDIVHDFLGFHECQGNCMYSEYPWIFNENNIK